MSAFMIGLTIGLAIGGLVMAYVSEAAAQLRADDRVCRDDEWEALVRELKARTDGRVP